MTVLEASVILDLPSQTVICYARTGLLEGHERCSGEWVLVQESVERLAGRTIGSTR